VPAAGRGFFLACNLLSLDLPIDRSSLKSISAANPRFMDLALREFNESARDRTPW
jgi:hypothetical protein